MWKFNMWKCYCSKCEKSLCQNETELQEGYHEGEWDNVCIYCKSEVINMYETDEDLGNTE